MPGAVSLSKVPSAASPSSAMGRIIIGNNRRNHLCVQAARRERRCRNNFVKEHRSQCFRNFGPRSRGALLSRSGSQVLPVQALRRFDAAA
jgi:hypothetical protein